MAPSLPQAAPTLPQNMISKRYMVYCDNDDDGCKDWYYWGRWVFAGVVVVFFFLLFVLWGCISSRRRRRRGVQPMYGTGWMSSPPKYPGPPGQGPGTYPPPPPAYGAPPNQPAYTGTSFSTGEGYYGHHEGIQMQPPQHSYQPANNRDYTASGANNNNDDYYAPPAGPPPGK